MSRAEEYLRRMKALGYEPSLAGMDDEDIEWELGKMKEAERIREAPPLRTVYRPVDPGLKARILRQMGRPYDKSAISPRESYYLNGWDDGEDEEDGAGEPAMQMPNFSPRQSGANEADWGPDPWAEAWRPDWGQGGNPLTRPWTLGYRTTRGGAMLPSRGGAYRPLSFTAGGNDAEAHMKAGAAANPYAGGYANGGAEGDMLFGVTGVTPQQPKQYVSADQLKAFGWQNVDGDMVRNLNNVLGKYEITTPARIRHFLAQCAQETNKGESYTEQDYGDKTYFDRMYEGRAEIGNIYPGDGKKFIGGGAIHITGRDEYQKFADYVGDPKVMERGAEYVAKKYPWVTAGRWWERNRMNELVDGLKGEDHDADVDKVTDVVNSGDEQKARKKRKDYHREIQGIIKD